MKVAIYARVSTKDQNINTQLELCRKHCEAHKYDIFDEYIDIGESCKKQSRPAFDEMLKWLRRYRFHAVCVYKIDRIGRSLPHLVNLFEEFKKKSVHFMSVSQNIDTTTAEGRMFMNMMMVLAQYEREMTVDRVKAGIQRARKEGKQIGRPKTGINGYEVIRLKNQGYSLRKIAEKLGSSLGTIQRCIKKHSTQNV